MIDPPQIKEAGIPISDPGPVVPVPDLHEQPEVTTSGRLLSTFSSQLSTAGTGPIVPALYCEER